MSTESGPRLAPPPVPIHTERLVLRHVTTDDLDGMRYYADPDVSRYLPLPALDEAGLVTRVETLAGRVAPSRPGDVLSLAVVHGGMVVGDVMLRLHVRIDDQSPPAVAEVGWVFAPAYGGRGFATEAATALITMAFDHYPLHRVFAVLDPRNDRSVALCERLGMTREAHLRRDFPQPDGKWSDSMIYGLLRDEWGRG